MKSFWRVLREAVLALLILAGISWSLLLTLRMAPANIDESATPYPIPMTATELDQASLTPPPADPSLTPQHLAVTPTPWPTLAKTAALEPTVVTPPAPVTRSPETRTPGPPPVYFTPTAGAEDDRPPVATAADKTGETLAPTHVSLPTLPSVTQTLGPYPPPAQTLPPWPTATAVTPWVFATPNLTQTPNGLVTPTPAPSRTAFPTSTGYPYPPPVLTEYPYPPPPPLPTPTPPPPPTPTPYFPRLTDIVRTATVSVITPTPGDLTPTPTSAYSYP